MEKPSRRRFIMGVITFSTTIPITTLALRTKQNLKGVAMLQHNNNNNNNNNLNQEALYKSRGTYLLTL
jgi:hypothetical protein